MEHKTIKSKNAINAESPVKVKRELLMFLSFICRDQLGGITLLMMI